MVVTRSVSRRARASVACAALALTGCTTEVTGNGAAATTTSTVSTSTGAPPSSGIDAGPASSALPVQGRAMRLVRVGADEVALQFEFVNGTAAPLAPDSLGLDEIERSLLLADLPRGTTYEMLTAQGLYGRISDNNNNTLAPNESATVTVVFRAPPQETTELTVLVDGLLPVEVPVQPVGAPGLVDDPVLRGARQSEAYVSPLVCKSEGPPDATGQAAVAIRLPSDVLFAFASAELSPDAAAAIAAAGDEIGGSSGTITIEGHTDSIGDDPSNQSLSEQRAAAVRAALEAELGGSFTYKSVGFGETVPVASNTKPDGSDDPDGRAQNRRVEIRTGEVAPAVTPTLAAQPVPTDLADAGLTAEVQSLERHAGHLMTRITVTNPTSGAIPLAFGSGLTPLQAEPVGVTLVDRGAQRRYELCHVPSRRLAFYYLANPSNDYAPASGGTVPPGATVTFWGFYPAPAAGVTSLDVEVGGFGLTTPTPVPG